MGITPLELILSKLNPLYFYLYNTPLTSYFKHNILCKNKSNLLLYIRR